VPIEIVPPECSVRVDAFELSAQSAPEWSSRPHRSVANALDQLALLARCVGGDQQTHLLRHRVDRKRAHAAARSSSLAERAEAGSSWFKRQREHWHTRFAGPLSIRRTDEPMTDAIGVRVDGRACPALDLPLGSFRCRGTRKAAAEIFGEGWGEPIEEGGGVSRGHGGQHVAEHEALVGGGGALYGAAAEGGEFVGGGAGYGWRAGAPVPLRACARGRGP
jgi:hypothetical protein